MALKVSTFQINYLKFLPLYFHLLILHLFNMVMAATGEMVAITCDSRRGMKREARESDETDNNKTCSSSPAALIKKSRVEKGETKSFISMDEPFDNGGFAAYLIDGNELEPFENGGFPVPDIEEEGHGQEQYEEPFANGGFGEIEEFAKGCLDDVPTTSGDAFNNGGFNAILSKA